MAGTTDNPIAQRQAAIRLFAAEIRGTVFALAKHSDNQYEAQLYLSPTGAKVSRVFIVGTATEIEDVGNESSFFRMRVSDPTGVAFITAGQYQPEAAQVIQDLAGKLPAFVAVVGKLSVYTPEQGTPLTSIRAEDISLVDDVTRNIWLLETAKATLGRIKALKGDAALAQEVATAYPGAKEDYKDIVKKLLIDMKAAPAEMRVPLPPAKPPIHEAPEHQHADKKPIGDPGRPTTFEEMVNFVEQKIISMNKGKGVKLDSLGSPCKAAGISLIQLETAISQLMHEGRIYEPKPGTVLAAEE